MKRQHAVFSANDLNTLKRNAIYPKLAKKSSDGLYCYQVQRRVSLYVTLFFVRKGIPANTATLFDFLLAVLASLCLFYSYYIAGVLLIQLFGIWSCVDGEIARLTRSPSKLGDFYDTMVDRMAEFIIVGAFLLSMNEASTAIAWGNIFFGYIGTVFLITASSEKFRSVFHDNYPKNRLEPFFCWLCAGSDIRFLYLSLAILAYSISGQVKIIQILLITQSLLLGSNFIFRLWKISRIPEEEKKASP